jgi:hypothetical protein
MTDASTHAGPSLAGRFAAAIALTIGFYVLALAIVAGCLAAAIVPWLARGSNNLWVTAIGVFLAFSVLSALIPRRLRYEPDGVRITAADQPRLFALVDEEVASANEAPPERVYATLQVNAAVTEVASRTRSRGGRSSRPTPARHSPPAATPRCQRCARSMPTAPRSTATG